MKQELEDALLELDPDYKSSLQSMKYLVNVLHHERNKIIECVLQYDSTKMDNLHILSRNILI